jgi:hypothetical protein
VDVLHTATLRLNNINSSSNLSFTTATVGHSIPATLTIKHTRHWARAVSATNKPLAFFYAIDAPTDGPWLVAGPKRSRFTFTNEDDGLTVSFVLVPLRAGVHLLPAVDIQPVAAFIDSVKVSDGSPSKLLRTNSAADTDDEATVHATISCETDYRSSGETIMVVRDARTTTAMVREKEGASLQRMSTATESSAAVRASGDSSRTARLL